MQIDRGGLYNLFKWLEDIINDKLPWNSIFELESFIWWKNSYLSTRFRLSQNKLQVFIPIDSIWLTVAEYNYDAKDLLENVLKSGLGFLQDIFKQHDMARMLMEHEAYSVNEVEAKFIHNPCDWFKKEEGCRNAIEAWSISRSVSKTIRRVGRDNLEIVNGIKYSSIFIKGYLIKDPYLNSFLPEKVNYSHQTCGWVSGSDPEVSYYVEKNEALTEKIQSAYRPIFHYQALVISGLRRVNIETDHLSFLQAVGVTDKIKS